ncbi:PLP-dependent aminotransferase family protein [Brasilonema sp. UFV-L1]|uniref:MocR-like pyridoxine biosynthesis transcription factor PdxR n=1 Tax=Brasilonema sp. UFV-L1 TaxID=2234130 RepID=UPI00145DBF4E|nr:PLP-dependent aminotransferase family protein [Brasilonema sp. UFV-L1]NMG10316.1 PLP-dependent aminotransferase family protein [Brasilonema sp. UFV-L1]
MTKQASSQELLLRDRKSGTPLLHWLYQELRLAILEGRLRPRSRLPSTRDLARQYCVSRGTVVVVFEQLLAEGYLESQVGSGTFVVATIPDELLQVQSNRVKKQEAIISSVGLSNRGRCMEKTPFSLENVTEIGKPFRAHQPALDAFPLDLWARISARIHRQAPRDLLANEDVKGFLPLREAVTDYLGTVRGVKCTPEQVVIVPEVQLALDIVARLVLDPEDPVWIEDPGDPGARCILKSVGARLIPIKVDREGINVALGLQICPQAKLAYVTPAHQCPLGVSMSLNRRLDLLKWARQTNAWIFEDDYNSEYRYQERPLTTLQGLDESDSVIYAGSFSKMLFPSLRLAYVVVPPKLINAFVAARSLIDRYCPIFQQAVLCEFMVEGHFARHIRRMRKLYANRLSALLDASRSQLNGLLDIAATNAGLETIGWLPEDIDDYKATTAAAIYGLEVQPLSTYAMLQQERNGLILGFASVDVSKINQGVELLAFVLQTLTRISHKL